MKGRQKGRPTKWVSGTVDQSFDIGKSGMTFEVWNKWSKQSKKHGKLVVTVGGLAWYGHSDKKPRRVSWDQFAEWFEEE